MRHLCGFSWVMNEVIFQSKPASHHRWCYREMLILYITHNHTHTHTDLHLFPISLTLNKKHCVKPHWFFSATDAELKNCLHCYTDTFTNMQAHINAQKHACTLYYIILYYYIYSITLYYIILYYYIQY